MEDTTKSAPQQYAAIYIAAWYQALHPHDDIDISIEYEIDLAYFTGLELDPEVDPNNAFLLIANKTRHILWSAHTCYWGSIFMKPNVETNTTTVIPATSASSEDIDFVRAINVIGLYLREIRELERFDWRLGSLENDEPVQTFFSHVQPTLRYEKEPTCQTTFDDETVLCLYNPQKGFLPYATVLCGAPPLVMSFPASISINMLGQAAQPLWEKHHLSKPQPLLDEKLLEQLEKNRGSV